MLVVPNSRFKAYPALDFTRPYSSCLEVAFRHLKSTGSVAVRHHLGSSSVALQSPIAVRKQFGNIKETVREQFGNTEETDREHRGNKILIRFTRYAQKSGARLYPRTF